MNRLKLWVYMLLVLGAVAGLALVGARELAARGLREMEATLSAAAARTADAQRIASAEAAAVLALAARDPRVQQALAGPPAGSARPVKGRAKPRKPDVANEVPRDADLDGAWAAAQKDAEKALGVSLPPGAVAIVASHDAIARRAALAGAAKAPPREVAGLLRDASAGAVARRALRGEDGLLAAVAVPAGGGAAAVLLLPVDDAWARRLAQATGVDVAIDADQTRKGAPPRPEETLVAASARKASGAVARVGSLPRVVLALPFPVKLPALPLVGAAAPERMAVAVPVAGDEKAAVVLSLAAAPRLEVAVRFEWVAIAGIAIALLVGLFFGLALHVDAGMKIPDGLVSAAARMERGDLSARAPALAGQLGTIAAGLNAAAEAAARASVATPAADSLAPPEGGIFELPRPAAPAASPAAVVSTSRLDGGALFGAFEAAPAAPAPAPPAPAAAVLDLAGAPPAAARAAPAKGGDEAHWQDVYQEFLRVRAECGEPSEGLTYEKFRVKLEKNKEQLVQKYACKAVKFQVYVKEGKAALKATPVR